MGGGREEPAVTCEPGSELLLLIHRRESEKEGEDNRWDVEERKKEKKTYSTVGHDDMALLVGFCNLLFLSSFFLSGLESSLFKRGTKTNKKKPPNRLAAILS